MSIQDRLKFEIDLNGNTIDVTSLVKKAGASRGRKSALAPNEPGDATIVLHDPDRDFDPFQTGTRNYSGDTFDNTDLVQGAKVTVSLRPSSSDPYKVRWTGTVTDWLPSIWEGDGTDRNPAVVVKCRGRVGDLNRVLTPTAGDLLWDKMTRAPSGCWHTFDDTTSTTVKDWSGKNAVGEAFTNEGGPTKGITAGAAFTVGNSVQFVTASTAATAAGTDGPDCVRSTMPGDTMRTGAGGFIMVAEIVLEATSGLPGTRDYDKWVIASDGSNRATSGDDGWVLYLEEDRSTVTPETTNNANTMAMKFVAVSNDDGTAGDTWTKTWSTMGTRDDWIGHERLVALMSDGVEVKLYVVSLDGVTIAGSTTLERVGLWSALTLGSMSESGDDPPHIVRFGSWPYGSTTTGWLGAASGEGLGFQGEFRSAILCATGASEEWGDQFAALALAEGGVSVPTAGDRIDYFIDDIEFPTADFTKDITSGLAYRHPANLGKATALARIDQICTNEQGRLAQKVGGDVEFDDFAACKSQCAVSGSEPTYSDQGGVGDLPYEDVVMSTGQDQIINRCTVRLNDSDRYTHTADDTTSQTAHGVRAAEFDLILTETAEADDYADAILDRFDTQRVHIARITVNPKSDSGWWDELDARDIGDRVNVERQPAGTGTVTSVASVLEGESWTWDAGADRLMFTFHFSPAAFYDNATFP